jgi:putative transposase
MARGKRYSEEQIIKVLGEIEAGASIASVSRAHGISDQTIYKWRERYQGMTKSDLTQLRALQDENRRLRHLVAELSLDNAAYKEVAKGKW